MKDEKDKDEDFPCKRKLKPMDIMKDFFKRHRMGMPVLCPTHVFSSFKNQAEVNKDCYPGQNPSKVLKVRILP